VDGAKMNKKEAHEQRGNLLEDTETHKKSRGWMTILVCDGDARRQKQSKAQQRTKSVREREREREREKERERERERERD